jgi:hypothetical protein
MKMLLCKYSSPVPPPSPPSPRQKKIIVDAAADAYCARLMMVLV